MPHTTGAPRCRQIAGKAKWESGDITADGERSGTPSGRRALEISLGEENVRGTVDYWISQKRGCFTAEMVLRIICSKVAMERCYEISKSEQEGEKANLAVFLLASIADVEALPWVREFLDNETQNIRWNGLMVLRTILDRPLGDAAIATAMELLDKAESDSDPEIQQRAKQIRLQFAMDNKGAEDKPNLVVPTAGVLDTK